MKKYPQLTAMGVLNPRQITSFSVNSIDYTDVLRVTYKRPKGSLLPVNKTFRFPRLQTSATDADGTQQGATVMAINPDLRAAISELQEITAVQEKNKDIASAILEELRLLEEDIECRSNQIKSLAAEIQKV